jgi:LPXTG-motif cell wall-anchored protein
MTINEETGMIRWKPKDDQVKIHEITVGVNDGIETSTYMFQIEVFESEEEGSGLLIMVGIIAVVIILLAVGIFFLFKKKKEMDERSRIEGEKVREEILHEKEGYQPTYEELYGVPEPEKDEEGMTTSELKDYIHDQIEELGD